eukprot:6206066-Pleurochrysis_carterae.AAC.1
MEILQWRETSLLVAAAWALALRVFGLCGADNINFKIQKRTSQVQMLDSVCSLLLLTATRKSLMVASAPVRAGFTQT